MSKITDIHIDALHWDEKNEILSYDVGAGPWPLVNTDLTVHGKTHNVQFKYARAIKKHPLLKKCGWVLKAYKPESLPKEISRITLFILSTTTDSSVFDYYNQFTRW